MEDHGLKHLLQTEGNLEVTTVEVFKVALVSCKSWITSFIWLWNVVSHRKDEEKIDDCYTRVFKMAHNGS